MITRNQIQEQVDYAKQNNLDTYTHISEFLSLQYSTAEETTKILADLGSYN